MSFCVVPKRSRAELSWYRSLNLVRGTLDQVDSTADISWVQPRVLEGGQLDTLAEQFDSWRNGVGETWQEVQMRYQDAREAVTA